MKKLIFILLLLTGCTSVYDGAVVYAIRIIGNDKQATYELTSGRTIYAPIGLYNVGDTIHFIKR